MIGRVLDDEGAGETCKSVTEEAQALDRPTDEAVAAAQVNLHSVAKQFESVQNSPLPYENNHNHDYNKLCCIPRIRILDKTFIQNF